MNMRQTRKAEMLNRVVDFGHEYGHLFPASSAAADTFAAVAAAVEKVQEESASRISSEDKGRYTRKAARFVLHDHLSSMVQAARAIGETTSGFAEKYPLPEQPNDPELIGAGRLFAANAAEAKKQFIAHSFPTTFIEDLTGLVDAFEAAVHERDAELRLNMAAQAAIDQAIEDGLREVRKLDAMVRISLKGEPLVTKVWVRVRQIKWDKRTPGKPAPVPAPADPDPTSPPAPASVATPPDATTKAA